MKYNLWLLAAVFLALNIRCSSQTSTPPRPNIVVIMADDMGFSDIGCYGAVKIKTPHIDSLAAEGVRLTRFYNNAWCSPTRASLLTGLYPQQVGMGVLAGPREGPQGPYQGYLNDRCVTLAEVLQQAGYQTLMSGKWHVGEAPDHWPVKRGFEHYFGLISGAANYFDITKTKEESKNSPQKLVRHMAVDDKPYMPPKEGFYMTQAITSHALEMLDNAGKQDKPFFLYLAYTAPHWPLQALPEDIAKYKGAFAEGWDSLRAQRYRHQQSLGLLGPESPLSPRGEGITPWDSLTPDQQQLMAAKMEVYAAQISRMDAGIGAVLQKIRALGKEDNTVVIFLSDNGACAEGDAWGFDKRHNGLPPGGVDSYMSYGSSLANVSNTPFQYYKKFLHEGGISAPFIVRWPAAIPPAERGRILTQSAGQSAHVIDIMPTLCDIAGAAYPSQYQGRDILPEEGESILPLLSQGSTWNRHRPLFWGLNGHGAMLLDSQKIVTISLRQPWELYNLNRDRSEMNDLAARDPEQVKRMAAMWRQWAERVRLFQGQEKRWGVKTR